MTAFIALFRGINVGGKNCLPMTELKALLEAQGYTKVISYIQSGNVLFTSKNAKIAHVRSNIEECVNHSFGFHSEVILRTPKELQHIVDDGPYRDAEQKFVQYYLFNAPPSAPDIAALNAIKSSTESFHLGKHALYLHAPEGIGRSKLAAKIEQRLGVPTTARNGNTLNKMLALASQ